MHVIRPATPEDAPEILAFIRELALYEREPDAVRASLSDILRDGWGPQKRFHCLLAESDGALAGFALYFHNYSTWRGHAGIHVEDLYVRPAYRRRGIGKALLASVAAIAMDEGCPRLQWDVLEWNIPAITFYEALGAKRMMEWRTMRISDSSLALLAAAASSGLSSDSPSNSPGAL